MKAIPPTGADALATKADLATLEERFGLRLQTGVAELRTEMAELRGDLRTEMAALRRDLRADIESKLRAQTWKLSGLLVGSLGVGITLARLG